MSSTELDPAKLLSLHTLTRDLAQTCLRHLKAQVETLGPLLRPRRYLGEHLEGTGHEGIAGADRNWAELQSLYERVAVKPFDLRPELRSPLPSIQTQFSLQEWEYLHPMKNDEGWAPIRVTSPLTWVLAYTSPYSLPTLREVVTGAAHRDPEGVRSYVLNACLIHELFRKFPALGELFTALRYKIEIRTAAQLGELPLVTVSAPFRTVRPGDGLVAMASGLSGGASFSEILDIESVRNIQDPLRDEAISVLRKHKIEI